MKKIIAVLMTVLFSFSAFGTAFAADTNELALGETKTVTLAADEELVYTFIPQFEGNYKITVESGAKCFTDVTVSNENNVLSTGVIVATDVKNYGGYNIQNIIKPLDFKKEIYVTVETGGAISIKLIDQTTPASEEWDKYSFMPSGLISCFTPSTVSVAVELADLETVNADEKVNVTDETILSFVPSVSGKHVFFCETVDGAEPEFEIYDCDGKVSVQGDGKEFAAELVADKNYIIKCRNIARSGYDASVLGSYTFEIKHVHTFGEWESNNDETFFKDGNKTRICTCGEKETATDENSAIIKQIFIRINEFFAWVLDWLVK